MEHTIVPLALLLALLLLIRFVIHVRRESAKVGAYTYLPGRPLPVTEWQVEVTWRDWRKAGSQGPTSSFGPFETEESRDAFVETQRRDRTVTAVRVYTRQATYTPWVPTGPAETMTEEIRGAAIERMFAYIARRRETADG